MINFCLLLLVAGLATVTSAEAQLSSAAAFKKIKTKISVGDIASVQLRIHDPSKGHSDITEVRYVYRITAKTSEGFTVQLRVLDIRQGNKSLPAKVLQAARLLFLESVRISTDHHLRPKRIDDWKSIKSNQQLALASLRRRYPREALLFGLVAEQYIGTPAAMMSLLDNVAVMSPVKWSVETNFVKINVTGALQGSTVTGERIIKPVSLRGRILTAKTTTTFDTQSLVRAHPLMKNALRRFGMKMAAKSQGTATYDVDSGWLLAYTTRFNVAVSYAKNSAPKVRARTIEIRQTKTSKWPASPDPNNNEEKLRAKLLKIAYGARHAEAPALARRLKRLIARKYGTKSFKYARIVEWLGNILICNKEFDAAEKALNASVALEEAAARNKWWNGAYKWRSWEVRKFLVWAKLGKGDVVGAVQLLQRKLEAALKERKPIAYDSINDVTWLLAAAHVSLGHWRKARPVFTSTLRQLERIREASGGSPYALRQAIDQMQHAHAALSKFDGDTSNYPDLRPDKLRVSICPNR